MIIFMKIKFNGQYLIAKEYCQIINLKQCMFENSVNWFMLIHFDVWLKTQYFKHWYGVLLLYV